jgi:phosphate transport system permease protein
MTAVASAGRSVPAFSASPGRGWRKTKDRLAAVLVAAAFGVALIPLIWLLWTVVGKGWTAITASGWWSDDLRNHTFSDPGGGAYHAIVGTAEEVAICTVISVPIALFVAIYLVEYGRGWFARLTTFMVDILTGVPSIVAALFIYAVFFIKLGARFAGAYAAFALVLLMIPVIVRTTEEMLKLVPNELREAAYALGVPKWKTIIRVVVPTALTGISTGIVLGIARVAGETAPLLILVQYQTNTNYNPISGFQASLPLMIKDQVKNLGSSFSFTGKKIANYAPERMWGAALTLIVIVMALNLIARIIARFSKVSN